MPIRKSLITKLLMIEKINIIKKLSCKGKGKTNVFLFKRFFKNTYIPIKAINPNKIIFGLP